MRKNRGPRIHPGWCFKNSVVRNSKHRNLLIALIILSGTVALKFYGCTTKKESTTPSTTAPAQKRSSDPFSTLGIIEERPEDLAFKLSPGPKPPPRVTSSVSEIFPPPGRQEGVRRDYGPLKVLRTQPEGTVGQTAGIAVSFNHPMIPLTSLEEQRKLPTPLEITPKLEGQYRWLGTSVIAFESKSRFPFSTEYKGRIPTGTRSAVDGVLEEEVVFSFQTPRTILENMVPHRGAVHALPENPIVLFFNQDMTPEDVLAHATLAAGRNTIPLELVPEEKWKETKHLGYSDHWNKDRTVVIRPARPMALNTEHTLTLSAGLGSAEGPLKTVKPQTRSFRTYGPLRVEYAGCWRGRPCHPGENPHINFNNSIETNDYDLEKQITVSPRVGELKVRKSGSLVYLQGEFVPGTTYRVTVGRNVSDIYGQKLGRGFKGTIRFLDAAPILQIATGKSGVLEARETRKLPVRSVNVKQGRVTLVEITPENVLNTEEILNKGPWHYRKTGKASEITGRRVQYTKRLQQKKNTVDTNFIDLDRILKGRGGTVFVQIFSKDLARRDYEDGYRYYVVSVTDLGLTVRYDPDSIASMVSGLTSGKPLKNIPVTIYDNNHKQVWRGKTDSNGMITPPGARRLGGVQPYLVMARHGDDWSSLVLRGSGSDGYVAGYSHASLPPKMRLMSHIHTDRDPYRPGDKVELAGTLRIAPTGPKGSLRAINRAGVKIRYAINCPRNREVEKGELDVDRDGMFHLSFQTEPGAPVGMYRFRGQVFGIPGFASNPYIHHNFSILEYRAPEHETNVELKGGPHFYGDKAETEIIGRYHFGAPMSGAETSWVVRKQHSAYRPPHHSGFHFGTWLGHRGHWHHQHGHRGGRIGHYWETRGPQGIQVDAGRGNLDENGRLVLTHELKRPSGDEIYPSTYTVEAQVYDVNRQSIADRAHFIAHPADVYVGLRLEESIIRAGRRAGIQVVTPDLDGKRQTGRKVEIEAKQNRSVRKKVKRGKSFAYEYEFKRVTAGRCSVISAKDVRVCELVLNDPGYYEIIASTTDSKGRKTTTKRGLYVFGKSFIPWRQDNLREVEIVADKEEYEPGETAKVLIKSPYRNAVGIMTVERQGIVSHRHINITSSTHVEEVPIEEYAIPNLYVSVVLVRGRVKGEKSTQGEDPGRPMFAKGRIPLPISKKSKEVNVEVLPAKKTIKPGETLTVRLKTTDHKGKPVSARITLMAVDEGVLSLLGFQTPDPLTAFFPVWGFGTALTELRERLLKKELPEIDLAAKHAIQRRSLPSTAARSAPAPSERIQAGSLEVAAEAADAPGAKGLDFKVRKHFATTAYFSHQVRTDSRGHGEVVVRMPENLTAFRFMAVAQDLKRRDRFGSGEERVRIAKELLLRPALPRFANFGDIFDAGVVVNNETGLAGNVTVKIQGTGFRLLEPDTKTVNMARGEAMEVRFKAAVTRPGLARFRFSAFLDKYTDSVEPPPIPVLLPASAEATAVYGVTDKSVAQPITPPENVLPQFGGMTISMSSTALTGMQDAVEYLVTYPYYSAEHLASGLVPIFSLRDILPEFGIASVSDRKALDEFAQNRIRTLISLQRPDGGFKYWASGWRSYPYPSVYATWALLRGKEAGYEIPDEVLRNASRYLSNVLAGRLEGSWHIFYATSVRIMAGWLLTEMQNADYLDPNLFSEHDKRRWGLKSHLANLYKAKDSTGLFAKAWLMTALHRLEGRSNRVQTLLRELENKAVQTPYGVHFAEESTESLRLLMHSNTRTDAIVLTSYIEVDPKNVIIPKMVRALMAARVHGRWETTQSNAFVMEGLARYFKQYEKEVPDFQAHVWYGKGYAGTGDFRGRSMDITERRIPMSFLLQQGKQDLVLAKEGPGKLYYRLGMEYTPESLKILPEEQGFMVQRVYEPVGDPGTVIKEQGDIWRIKAGSYVRVRLTIVVPDRRYFVAVNDPMPAGFEGVDLQLKTTASTELAGQSQNKIYDFRSYFSFLGPNHREMRDERYVLFWDRLPAGVYEYTYLTRATTLGRFVVPPLKAMEMYHPEVFGRNGTQVVIVE